MESDESEKNKKLCIIITSVLCVVFGLIILVGIGLYLRENYMIVSRYEYSPTNPSYRRDNYGNYRGSYYREPPREPPIDGPDYGC